MLYARAEQPHHHRGHEVIQVMMAERRPPFGEARITKTRPTVHDMTSHLLGLSEVAILTGPDGTISLVPGIPIIDCPRRFRQRRCCCLRWSTTPMRSMRLVSDGDERPAARALQ
jgi:hypothetical protein